MLTEKDIVGLFLHAVQIDAFVFESVSASGAVTSPHRVTVSIPRIGSFFPRKSNAIPVFEKPTMSDDVKNESVRGVLNVPGSKK